MTRIELTETEAGILMEILESSLSELRTEKIGTDNRAWHVEMAEREKFLMHLIDRLQNEQ